MPYVWLALSGLALFVATSRTGPFATKVGLLVVAGSVSGFTDLLIVLFRLYEFHPGLLLSRTADCQLGMFLADGMFVPMLASSVVGSARRWRYLAGLALVVVPFLFVENEFLIRQLFVHVRWKLWYSAALFAVYVTLISTWADDFERNGYSVRNRVILVVTTLYYLWIWYSVLTSGVLNLYTLRPHWLADPQLDNVLGGFMLRFLPFSMVGLIWIWNRWVDQPARVALLLAVLAGWYLMLSAMGIYRLRAPWHLAYAALSAALLILLAGRLDRWFAAARPRPRAGT